MNPVPEAEPIETQEAEPLVTVAVIFGTPGNGVAKVTVRVKADT